MTNMDRNSFDRVNAPERLDWGLVLMLVTLLAVAAFLLVALP